MPTTKITSDINYLSAEINRCNRLLIENLTPSARLDMMEYQQLLHAQLLIA